MPKFVSLLFAGAGLLLHSSAVPTEAHQLAPRDDRNGVKVADVTALASIIPTATPTTIPEATSILSSIFSAKTDLAESVTDLILNGFSPGDLVDVLKTYSIGCNSILNVNLQIPDGRIFPKKSESDAPYSLSELTLRAAIQIPFGFTYGEKTPLIMAPGTGSTGCLTFRSNFVRQFTDSKHADPVWLNIPDFLYNDAQQNSEYVAYAINYISAISDNKNVSVIAWSQGNLDTQWALKYWPSTRKIVSDLIAISPDFHGTTVSASLGALSSSSPPSILQQAYGSNFIATLRSDGGDSAYVPTTSVFSSTDEIVSPQSGTNASAYIKDARHVGVSNSELQVVCAGTIGGIYATHEGMLYNALAYALAIDALKHPGPGRTSRIDLSSICNQVASPGLSVSDIIATESNIVIALVINLLYPHKVTQEPGIMGYAASWF